jgi:TIR domain
MSADLNSYGPSGILSFLLARTEGLMTARVGRDLHSALKTEKINNLKVSGMELTLQRLQWAKDEIAFSLHISPNTFTTSGIQLTDALAYVGFQRQRCPFLVTQDGYCDWVDGEIDLSNFAESLVRVHEALSSAERHFTACGLRLPKPEGFGYFFGKLSTQRALQESYGADGHTSPSTEILKISEDQGFFFKMTWIKGGTQKGWTFHYSPKHPPLSIEVQAGFEVLGLKPFESCPQFDFDPCHWNFYEFIPEEDHSPWNNRAQYVHHYFEAHAENFSAGLEKLLLAQSTTERFGRSIFQMPAAPLQRAVKEIERAVLRPEKPAKLGAKKFQFDIAISFAGTERKIAEDLANHLKDAGFAVFYDSFYPEMLWGKDLVEFFDDIYRKQARYCVMFVSPEYRDRMWTQHERRSAQARALEERGHEYILPVVAAPAELPGLQPTIGYLNLSDHTVEKIAEILIQKLNS